MMRMVLVLAALALAGCPAKAQAPADGGATAAPDAPTFPSNAAPDVGDGGPCGGIAGLRCPDGFHCEMSCPPGTADCGGHCVRR